MRTFPLLLLAVSAFAQGQAPLGFEVASVKIDQQFSEADRSTWTAKMDTSPGRVTMLNINLGWVVAWAYDIQRPQVAGPPWFNSVRYDIVAKAAYPAKESEMRSMMRALLADRFKLATRRETRLMDAMALTQPKGGNKRNRQDPTLGMVTEGETMPEMAEELSHDLAMPVVDMTGLKGRFDFPFNAQKYVTALRSGLAGEANPPSEPELRVMLMQDIVAGELGLRLESRRAPVEVLIIDHVEKSPVDN